MLKDSCRSTRSLAAIGTLVLATFSPADARVVRIALEHKECRPSQANSSVPDYTKN
jgi:hypothetical protein